MFPEINDYTYSCQQINPVTYRVNVISPDKVKMYIDIQSQGFPPPNGFIFSLIQNKEARKKFTIELEEIKPAPVEEIKIEEIKEVIEPEIKNVDEIPIESAINIDLPPESDKVEEVTGEAKTEVAPQENKV